MEKAHRKVSAFDEEQLRRKREGAEASRASTELMGWTYTFEAAPGGDSYDLCYTRCGLCSLGKQEHLEKLIPYLCLADYETMEMMGARLTRTQTLAGGGTCCDFHVERKKAG